MDNSCRGSVRRITPPSCEGDEAADKAKKTPYLSSIVAVETLGRRVMPVVEEVCTITAKGQTTVPKAVRQALGVGYGGRIAFRVARGRVTVHALPEGDDADPALAPFLALLEGDITSRPSRGRAPASRGPGGPPRGFDG